MGFDPDDRRFSSRYSAEEAARFLGASPEFVREWFYGTGATKAPPPLYVEPEHEHEDHLGVSFMQLIEAHVALCYRKLGVPLERLLKARECLKDSIDADYPFAARRLLFLGADQLREFSLKHPPDADSDPLIVFDDSTYGHWRLPPQLVNALDPVDYDPVSRRSLAYQFYPFGRDVPIVIYPPCGSGRLTVEGRNLLAEVISGYHRGGDTVPDIADDFELEEDEVWKVIKALNPV